MENRWPEKVLEWASGKTRKGRPLVSWGCHIYLLGDGSSLKEGDDNGDLRRGRMITSRRKKEKTQFLWKRLNKRQIKLKIKLLVSPKFNLKCNRQFNFIF